jgi:hypothetical protein
MYAIEAVALFDHYHFRKVMQTVTAKEPPLTLWYPGKPNAPNPWWQAYYDPKAIQMRDRLLFAAQPLPPGLAATKTVDWSAIDAAAAKPAAKGKGAAKGGAAKGGAAKKKPAKAKPAKTRPAKSKSAKTKPAKTKPAKKSRTAKAKTKSKKKSKTKAKARGKK